MFSKIRNDTFRTLATDLNFREKVGEVCLVRCLEAFVWRQLGRSAPSFELNYRLTRHSSDAAGDDESGTHYIQGMNVLAAPFLYVMPTELEAFACFSSFIEVQAPRYVRPTLEGVHLGLQVRCSVLCGPRRKLTLALAARRPVPPSRRSRAIRASPIVQSWRRTLRFPLPSHLLGLDPAAPRGARALGLPSGVGCRSKCPLRGGSGLDYEG